MANNSNNFFNFNKKKIDEIFDFLTGSTDYASPAQETDEHHLYLNRKEFEEICEHVPGLEDIHTKDDLRAFFSQPKSKGIWLKDIMETVGFPVNQIYPDKKDRLEWVIQYVEIEGIADPAPASESGSENDEPDKPAPSTQAALITLEGAQLFFENLPESCFRERADLDITTITVHEGMSVEFQDEFCIKYTEGLSEGLAVVLRGQGEQDGEKRVVAAVGVLQKSGSGKEYHILLDRENINFSAFQNNKKYRLALFPAGALSILLQQKQDMKLSDILEYRGEVYTIPCTINYKPMEEVGNTLCIDFGTSNTSAGSYGILNKNENNIELVPFVDVTTPAMKKVNLYPTLVYVEDCSDPEHIRYRFGYEARKLLMENKYDTEASVFFEIKRWIGTMDETEEIQDANGNSTPVLRKDIVRAYLLHVIDLAQQHFKVRFKTLHLSAPVKLKVQFHEEMKGLLDGYTVVPPENSVDEGVAILYDSISRLVAAGEINEDEETSIMILDCGGGTTDLASCKVSAKKLQTSMKLKITTEFVNGNSNFGGNNITFRILQLLKIKLAKQYAPDLMSGCDLKELIPKEESGILAAVEGEEDGAPYNSDRAGEIYRKFQEAYARAEQVIPTVFTDNPAYKFQGDRKKIRRNYYYLWQLAEKIKIKFYEDDAVSVGFRSHEKKELEFDRLENDYLYLVPSGEPGGELKEVRNPAEKVSIDINEIRKVLCGDIYGLLNELLQQLPKLDSYRYYRLAGQSCRINLFMELLKEFIPGRKLRTSHVSRAAQSQEDSAVTTTSSARYKLDCIRGCIAYIRDTEYSKIHPEMIVGQAKLIYDIYARKGDAEEKLLSKEAPNKIRFVSVHARATRLEVLVKNTFGETERKIDVAFKFQSTTNPSLQQLKDSILESCAVTEEGADELINSIASVDPRRSDESDSVRMVFVVPSKLGYGMNIYRLLKSQEGDTATYTLMDVLYKNYENESTKSFFDGRR